MIKAISAPIEEKEEGRNYLDSFLFLSCIGEKKWLHSNRIKLKKKEKFRPVSSPTLSTAEVNYHYTPGYRWHLSRTLALF